MQSLVDLHSKAASSNIRPFFYYLSIFYNHDNGRNNSATVTIKLKFEIFLFSSEKYWQKSYNAKPVQESHDIHTLVEEAQGC